MGNTVLVTLHSYYKLIIILFSILVTQMIDRLVDKIQAEVVLAYKIFSWKKLKILVCSNCLHTTAHDCHTNYEAQTFIFCFMQDCSIPSRYLKLLHNFCHLFGVGVRQFVPNSIICLVWSLESWDVVALRSEKWLNAIDTYKNQMPELLIYISWYLFLGLYRSWLHRPNNRAALLLHVFVMI